jgi:hypothetical protein
MRLGRPLLFPVSCRHCGASIWLFADPNGGFAVFDDIGAPWPKHECSGVRARDPRYTDPSPLFSGAFRDFPVPDTVRSATPVAGTRIAGFVVRSDQTLFGRQLAVLCAKVVYLVLVAREYGVGTALAGTAEQRVDGTWLGKVRYLPMPTRADLNAPARTALQTMPVTALAPDMLWALEDDIASLNEWGCAAASVAIRAVVHAVGADQLVTATAALAASVLFRGPAGTPPIPVAVRHVRVLLLTLRDDRLVSCAPPLLGSLPSTVRSAVRSEAAELVRTVVDLGAAVRERTPLLERRRDLEARLAAEQSYWMQMSARFPRLEDYVGVLRQSV